MNRSKDRVSNGSIILKKYHSNSQKFKKIQKYHSNGSIIFKKYLSNGQKFQIIIVTVKYSKLS